MIRYPVYQKLNMDTDNKDLQVQLASVLLAQKRREEAIEDLQETTKSIEQFSDKVTKLVNEVISVTNADESPEELTKQVKETLGIDALENKVSGLNVVISQLDEIEEKLQLNMSKDFRIQTHSFSLVYHNRGGWKDTEQFMDFVDEHINSLNENGGADILNAYAVEGEPPTVLFRFDPNDKEKVENFILSLTRDIVQDYNHYVENDEYLSSYLDSYTAEGTTEHPFSLYGTTGMNLFSKIANPKFKDLSLSELKEAIAGDYGVPENGHLVQYQVMMPHFKVPDSHPLKNDLNQWYSGTFSAMIGDGHISKDREGYDKVSKITRDVMFESYPEIEQRAQKVLGSMQLNQRMSQDATYSVP